MIINILNENELIAIIIKNNFHVDGIKFFTPDSFSQQLGYMKREVGYQIEPHVHNPVVREVVWTQEVLFIKSGKVRVDFYNNEKKYIQSNILDKGDVVLLAAGGHGFKILEEAEIIEVKQGPYCSDKDKTRFEPVSDNEVRFLGE